MSHTGCRHLILRHGGEADVSRITFSEAGEVGKRRHFRMDLPDAARKRGTKRVDVFTSLVGLLELRGYWQ